ncbi:MAG: hypothetical protein AAB671_02355 [Patescibacteria group bacterium]
MAQERIIFSDLEFRGSSLDIAVFSPTRFGDFSVEEVAKSRRKWFSMLAYNISNFSCMQHDGMLTCSGVDDHNQSQGEPLEFVRCGGSAQMGNHAITCNTCGTAFVIAERDRKNFSGIMFYLMLKQMVPSIAQFCSFVDCSITPESERFAGNFARLAEIRSLGVVAVHRCLLYLLPEAEGVRGCGLGFMLAPEMRTRTEGPGKFGPWLQYLVCEWYSKVKGSEDESRALRYGPKPVRD